MKILVLSDTHGHIPAAANLPAQLKKADCVIFLGDGSREADDIARRFPRLPLYRVRGNCDLGSLDPNFGLSPFGGVLVFYTHGHLFGVKQGLETLWERAEASGASVALFGHTHAAHCEQRDGIWLFNPGALTQPRLNGPSFGIITIEEGRPAFETVYI